MQFKMNSRILRVAAEFEMLRFDTGSTPSFASMALIVVLTTLFAGSGLAQVDKPNDLFEQVWDGGTETIRRCWEIEGDFDLDQDGKREFAAYDADGRVLYLWEGHGNGDNQFDLIWQGEFTDTGSGERSVFVTDLDNDGREELVLVLDLVAGIFQPLEPMLIYEWNGEDNGLPDSSTPTAMYTPPKNENGKVALEVTSEVRNMDSDPEPEFVLTYRGGANMLLSIISLENGDLENPQWKVEFTDGGLVGATSHGVGIGDLNNDGHMDVLISNDGNPGPFYVFTNTGEDSYERVMVKESSELPEFYTGCKSTMVITDVNEDGSNECFIFGQEGFIYLIQDVTDLTQIFEPAHFLDLFFLFPQEPSDFRSGELGDFDNDGLPGFLMATNQSNGIAEIEWNNVTNDNDPSNPDNYGVYILWLDDSDRFETVQATAGDFDGDGPDHQDIVFSISPEVGGEPGIFMIEYDPSVTSVDLADLTSSLPNSFTLYQNSPNPFNPSTEIRFELSQSSAMSLAIHDLLGREVRKLVVGERAAGSHKVVWDGEDNFGRPAASGLYLYTLRVDGLQKTMKLVLLR